VALLFANKVLEGLNPPNSDQKVGIGIVRKAIQSPVRQIAQNAGTDGSIVVGKLTDKNDPNFGYDAQSGEYKDMVTAGIIDRPEPKAAAGMPPGGGMGGMGGMDY